MVRRWLGLLVLVVVTGCGAGDSPALDQEEAPRPQETASTTTSTSPSTTASTATAGPGPACGNVFVGAGNPEQVDLEADVDGDGRDDAVSAFRSEGDEAGRAYVLQVSLAAGGGAATQIPAPADASVALLGGGPLDRFDGRDVLWVRVGSGAATTILGLFHLDDCDLEAATFANGEPVELPIGGTVRTASGAECGSTLDPEADLLVREATHLDGQVYEVTTTEYRWADGVLAPSPHGEPAVSETGNPAQVARFQCGDLAL